MMNNTLLLSILLSIAVLASPLQAREDGLISVTLSVTDGQIELVDSTLFPGASPRPLVRSNTEYRLLDSDGFVLARGITYIPRTIVQEYADEAGMMHGREEPYRGGFSIELPAHALARTIELYRDGTRILSSRLHLQEQEPRPASAPQGVRPMVGTYLDSFVETPEQTTPASATSPSADMVTVTGEGFIKRVKAFDQVVITVRFYPLETFDPSLHYETTTDSNGEFSIDLPEGEYRVQADCVWFDPENKGEPVRVYPGTMHIDQYSTDDGPLKLKWKQGALFKGRVVDPEGRNTPSRVYIVDRKHDGTTHRPYRVTSLLTDLKGRFSIRLPKKRFAMVVTPLSGLEAGELLTVVKVKKKNRNVELTLPPFRHSGGPALQKIWDAGSEQERLNILFIADGYTDGNEEFTDLNGNGSWDGDILMDLNDNGSWERGEYFHDRNVNRVYDEPEPFVDSNGDFICNRNERARFELDCLIHVATMFSFEPFSRYDDSINVFTYWEPSRHAMPRFSRIPDFQNMESVLGAFGSGTDGFQGAGTSVSVDNKARQVLPNAGTIQAVAMIHDPINALRANAVFGFGRVLMSAEDTRAGATLVHEFGHSIGNLWDEYIYSGALSGGPSSEPTAVNVTISEDPATVKWAGRINGDVPVPTPVNYNGYGLFEGAGRYETGVYRSRYLSMMRSTGYPFFEVNEAGIAAVLDQFKP